MEFARGLLKRRKKVEWMWALMVDLHTRLYSTEMKTALPPVKGSSGPQYLFHIAVYRGHDSCVDDTLLDPA